MPSTDHHVDSLPPLEADTLRVLVLGTMPGVQSIVAQQYYAHPRNAFWPIALAHCSGLPLNARTATAMPYTERVQHVIEAGLGVWDVLAHCERPGSLDSAIVRDSEVPNDLAALAARHPELERVVLNGKTAERLFRRHVLNTEEGDNAFARVTRCSAPSTSPAMASLSLEEKFARWSEALGTSLRMSLGPS